MQLFYYLYIVVVVIPFKQIKVTMLKAFSLLPKQEILSQSHTTSSLTIDTTIISDLTTTTLGITTITGDLTTAVGTTLITGVGIIALIILAFLADRWLNRKQELESMDLEEELTNQDF